MTAIMLEGEDDNDKRICIMSYYKSITYIVF